MLAGLVKRIHILTEPEYSLRPALLVASQLNGCGRLCLARDYIHVLSTFISPSPSVSELSEGDSGLRRK